MTKFETFKAVFDNAIAHIQECQTNKDMKNITNWLLETETNPWGFLPEAWASATTTAEGMSSLLYYIHHALVDDGDICFPVVRGVPRIVFVWKGEFDLTRDINSHYQYYEKDDEVTFLPTIDDFIRERNQYDIDDLKRCVIGDLVRLGEDYIVKYYSQKTNYNPEWLNDPEVEVKRDKLRKAGFIK